MVKGNAIGGAADFNSYLTQRCIMSNANQTNHAEDQAKAQYESMASMVSALQVDYDRLEELKDEKESIQWDIDNSDDPQEQDEAIVKMQEFLQNDNQELRDLLDAANGCTDQEEARAAIQEDPLSVQVRSDWENSSSEFAASEFQILLCTGGPAVRIMGELQKGQPCRAWLEYQDWGTPWTMYFGADQSVLLAYCQEFYFGE